MGKQTKVRNKVCSHGFAALLFELKYSLSTSVETLEIRNASLVINRMSSSSQPSHPLLSYVNELPLGYASPSISILSPTSPSESSVLKRGIFAVNDIKKGERILTVPINATIGPHFMKGDDKVEGEGGMSDWLKTAISLMLVMAEFKSGKGEKGSCTGMCVGRPSHSTHVPPPNPNPAPPRKEMGGGDGGVLGIPAFGILNDNGLDRCGDLRAEGYRFALCR